MLIAVCFSVQKSLHSLPGLTPNVTGKERGKCGISPKAALLNFTERWRMDFQEMYRGFFFFYTSRTACRTEDTSSYLYNGDLKNEEKPHVVFLKVVLKKASIK